MKGVYLVSLSFMILLVNFSSGCILAYIEDPHMETISPWRVGEAYFVNVVDENGLLGSIVLDLVNEDVKKAPEIIPAVYTGYFPTEHNYKSSLTFNDTQLLLEVKESSDEYLLIQNISFENSTIELDLGYRLIISKSLGLVYLVFPYDIYQATIEDYPMYGANSSLFIFPLNNSENYYFLYSLDSYYFLNDQFKLYDDYQILQIYGQGADCIGSIYLEFSKDGFNHLYSSFSGDSSYAELSRREFITISYDWNQKVDIVKVENEDGQITKSFTITPNQMLQALGETTENSTLNLSFMTLSITPYALFSAIYVSKKKLS